MLSALDNPVFMDTAIRAGAALALFLGLGVLVSLALGSPVKMAVPVVSLVRRKR